MSLDLDNKEIIELFEEVFRHGGGCACTCMCGKTYVTRSNDYDWDEGEFEAAIESGAIEVSYSIGDINFGCGEFADACECWHKKALQFYHRITGYDREITELLARRIMIRLDKAKEAATVKLALHQLVPDKDADEFMKDLEFLIYKLR